MISTAARRVVVFSALALAGPLTVQAQGPTPCHLAWQSFLNLVRSERLQASAQRQYYIAPESQQVVLDVRLLDPRGPTPDDLNQVDQPIKSLLHAFVRAPQNQDHSLLVVKHGQADNVVSARFQRRATDLAGDQGRPLFGKITIGLELQVAQGTGGHYYFELGGTAFCSSYADQPCGTKRKLGFGSNSGPFALSSVTVFRSEAQLPVCKVPKTLEAEAKHLLREGD